MSAQTIHKSQKVSKADVVFNIILYGICGLIEEGALADLLVIEGNPLERIEVLENPHDNLRVIVKDGVVCKNTL